MKTLTKRLKELNFDQESNCLIELVVIEWLEDHEKYCNLEKMKEAI